MIIWKGISSKTKFSENLSLSSNIEIISAIANDISFEIFVFQLSKLAHKNDCLITISSSGNSKILSNPLNGQKMI